MTKTHAFSLCSLTFLTCSISFSTLPAGVAVNSTAEVGIAVRDISPELPIWLAGYAGRKRPADKIDQPLLVEALAFKNLSGGDRFVFVSLDNCEVGHAFMQPVLQQLVEKFQLRRGEVAVVSSHTHSAPVLDQTLADMVQPSPAERDQIEKYSQSLRAKLVDVVGAAIADCQPATLEQGIGRRHFCHEPSRLPGRPGRLRR